LTDEETEIVEEQTQEVDQSTESEDQQTERQEEQPQQTPQRRDVEYNWAEARRASQEKDRLIREQQEVINRLSKNKSTEDEPQLSSDDILTVGQLQKFQEAERKKQAADFDRQREEILRLKYPDIDQVLSPENIAHFEQMEPELAESLCGLGHDPIKMKAAAYKMIKKTIPRETPPSMEKKKAQINSQKPVSVQSVAKSSPIGNAHIFENGLTPELAVQLRKEMEDAASQG